MNLSSNSVSLNIQNSHIVPPLQSIVNTINSPSTLPIVTQNNHKLAACDDCGKVVNIKSMKQHKKSIKY